MLSRGLSDLGVFICSNRAAFFISAVRRRSLAWIASCIRGITSSRLFASNRSVRLSLESLEANSLSSLMLRHTALENNLALIRNNIGISASYLSPIGIQTLNGFSPSITMVSLWNLLFLKLDSQIKETFTAKLPISQFLAIIANWRWRERCEYFSRLFFLVATLNNVSNSTAMLQLFLNKQS